MSNPLAPNLSFSPITGWAFEKAAATDLNGARGLLADISTASTLKRQAAFAVLASVPDDPQPFLVRLGLPNGTIGDAIRTRRARDLLAACFEIENVPTGFFRALLRVGPEPLSEPRLYLRLFNIFRDATQTQKAHALRYCGPLNAEKIRAVDLLDPVLIHPEILKSIRTAEQARRANLLLRFVREIWWSATDEALALAFQQAIGSGGLEGFARKALYKADRFPPPPLQPDPEFTPLTTAAAMIATGKAMRNCLRDKIGEVLLGFCYIYTAQVRLATGARVQLAIELTPLSNGVWAINGLFLPKGQGRLPPGDKLAITHKLLSLGAVVQSNPQRHPDAQKLIQPLGIFRYGEFDLLVQDEADGDPEEAPDVLDLALQEIDREFGLA